MDVSRAECSFFRAFPELARCPLLILTIILYAVRYLHRLAAILLPHVGNGLDAY